MSLFFINAVYFWLGISMGFVQFYVHADRKI